MPSSPPGSVKFQVSGFLATWADIAKAQRLLDWSPEITPAEGFRKTVEWHLESKSWLKEIRL